MEQLPKLLQTTLEQLVCEHKLLKWNLQAFDEVVYINLCFVPPGSNINTSTPVPGYRKKSPSQATRDFERHRQWKNKYSSPQDTGNYVDQCINEPNLCSSEKNIICPKSDRSCLTGSRSSDIEPDQHDVCDPHIESIASERDSLMQDQENNDSCSAETSDQPKLNEDCHLKKVVYDEAHDVLIAMTSDGQYIPYKCNDNTEDPQSDYSNQRIYGAFFLSIYEQHVHDICETQCNVINDPKYKSGIEYFKKVMKCGVT